MHYRLVAPSDRMMQWGGLMSVGPASRTGLSQDARDLMASRLLEARLAVGMSRTQVAALAKIADNSIYRYEKGLNAPRPEILVTLARIYGRPVEWFRGGSQASAEPAWQAPQELAPVGQPPGCGAHLGPGGGHGGRFRLLHLR